MQVRTADPGDVDAIMQLLDAAALETDRALTERSVAADRAVLAVEDGRLLGGAVCVPADPGVRIDAIAVRKRRQAQGVGTALVERLLDDHERVVAEFDERVRPFYASLGFVVERVEETGRYRGVRRD